MRPGWIRSTPTLAFGALGLILSLGLLRAAIREGLLQSATLAEVLVPAIGGLAGAVMSLILMSDSVGRDRRSRPEAKSHPATTRRVR